MTTLSLRGTWSKDVASERGLVVVGNARRREMYQWLGQYV